MDAAEHDALRQMTLRVPDELHKSVTEAAEVQGQSLNTFPTNALLSQVGAKSFSEWRSHIDSSHRAAGFRGTSNVREHSATSPSVFQTSPECTKRTISGQ
jgi:HicB family